MLKQLCKIKFLVLLMAILIPTPILASNPISIQINGIHQGTGSDADNPYMTNGVTMVPLAFISESLGHTVEWKASNKQVIIDDGKIVLTLNNKSVLVNKTPVTLSMAPTIKNGRTYVPLRFISSALGYGVDFENNIIDITASSNGDGKNSGNNPTVDINQIAKSKGYELGEYKSVDLNKDGIKDYIAILFKSWDGYLLVIDGSTGETLATQKIIPGEYGTSLDVYNIRGSYHIMSTAHDKQPWQGFYEWKDGSLKSHRDILDEKFDVKLGGKNIVEVKFPQPAYNQKFVVSNDAYGYLRSDMSWYPFSVARIENGILAIDKEIRLPGIDNSGQFQIIEQYNWNGSNWVINKVLYNSYSSDFRKAGYGGDSNQNEVAHSIADEELISIIAEGTDRFLDSMDACEENYRTYKDIYGSVKQEFNSRQKIENYLSSYWSKSIIKDFLNIWTVEVDGVLYMKLGDPGITLDYKKGKVIEKIQAEGLIKIRVEAQSFEKLNVSTNFTLALENGKWVIKETDFLGIDEMIKYAGEF